MKNTGKALRTIFTLAMAVAFTVLSLTACDNGSNPTPPVVTSVTVSPATATVDTGETKSFSAAVEGTGNPSQAVDWSIDQAGKKAGTTISGAGLLTVAANEALATLTVRATSVADPTKSGTATVTVNGESQKAPEEKTTTERWGIWSDPKTTATITHSVSADGVCTITVGGTPEQHSDGVWDRWKVSAAYAYTAKKNTSYTYVFEAWTQTGTRDVNIQYFNDEENEIHNTPLGRTMTSTRQPFTVVGETVPFGGTAKLEFQCADQLGTFYVKIISITENAGDGNNEPLFTLDDFGDVETYDDEKDGGKSTITAILDETTGEVSISGTLQPAKITVPDSGGHYYYNGYVGLAVIPTAEALTGMRTGETLSFRVKGDGNKYRVIVPTNEVQDYDYFFMEFQTTNNEWKDITVNLDGTGLTQGGWGVQGPYIQNSISGIELQFTAASFTDTAIDSWTNGSKAYSFQIKDLAVTVTTTQAGNAYTTIADITAYLNTLASNTVNNPVYLPVAIDLGTMAAGSGWQQLLDAINTADKYVDLDLSDCTMTGTKFGHDNWRSSHSGMVRIVSITLPSSGVVSLEDNAFYRSANLKQVALPETLTTIGESSFKETGLTSITLPSSLTNMQPMAFMDSKSLESIIIPASITLIKYRAFEGCTRLTTVTCLAGQPPAMENTFSGLFSGTHATLAIKVPADSVAAYKAASGWSSYASRITAIDGEIDITITIAAIPGVSAPVTGAIPVTAITETAQYTGTVTWNGNPATFAANTAYTATITLTAKEGYTLQGVTANFFSVAGTSTHAANDANSGVITAVFPATGPLGSPNADYFGTWNGAGSGWTTTVTIKENELEFDSNYYTFQYKITDWTWTPAQIQRDNSSTTYAGYTVTGTITGYSSVTQFQVALIDDTTFYCHTNITSGGNWLNGNYTKAAEDGE